MNSRRRTRKRIIEESLLLNCEQRKEEKEKESFEAKFINELIGQGVFTKKDFIEGEVLLEYSGELIEGDVDVDDTYVFQIRYKGKQYCIDATKERSLGRLLNDDHRNPNCKPKIIEKDGKPHVYFVALRDINTGEELRYNYGPGIYSWRTSKKVFEVI
uniref:N-lysine methyltransferase KMT5A-like n=1 Tax=Crassostrea virginica TaxID=6565 RepID=A0A8B8AWF7_CRAVI|nr:N-lysine methyltransferase KMT5A-like [Crassostrea virginica]